MMVRMVVILSICCAGSSWQAEAMPARKVAPAENRAIKRIPRTTLKVGFKTELSSLDFGKVTLTEIKGLGYPPKDARHLLEIVRQIPRDPTKLSGFGNLTTNTRRQLYSDLPSEVRRVLASMGGDTALRRELESRASSNPGRRSDCFSDPRTFQQEARERGKEAVDRLAQAYSLLGKLAHSAGEKTRSQALLTEVSEMTGRAPSGAPGHELFRAEHRSSAGTLGPSDVERSGNPTGGALGAVAGLTRRVVGFFAPTCRDGQGRMQRATEATLAQLEQVVVGVRSDLEWSEGGLARLCAGMVKATRRNADHYLVHLEALHVAHDLLNASSEGAKKSPMFKALGQAATDLRLRGAKETSDHVGWRTFEVARHRLGREMFTFVETDLPKFNQRKFLEQLAVGGLEQTAEMYRRRDANKHFEQSSAPYLKAIAALLDGMTVDAKTTRTLDEAFRNELKELTEAGESIAKAGLSWASSGDNVLAASARDN